MTIAERILLVVEKNGGNMSKVAKELNVTPAYISKLKNNPDASPSNLFIKTICDRYGINETWLRTGEGEMSAPPSREQEIAQITAQIIKAEDNDFRYQLQLLISQLSEEQLEVARDMALMLVEIMNNEKGH